MTAISALPDEGLSPFLIADRTFLPASNKLSHPPIQSDNKRQLPVHPIMHPRVRMRWFSSG
jgi:hypothetical protein